MGQVSCTANNRSIDDLKSEIMTRIIRSIFELYRPQHRGGDSCPIWASPWSNLCWWRIHGFIGRIQLLWVNLDPFSSLCFLLYHWHPWFLSLFQKKKLFWFKWIPWMTWSEKKQFGLNGYHGLWKYHGKTFFGCHGIKVYAWMIWFIIAILWHRPRYHGIQNAPGSPVVSRSMPRCTASPVLCVFFWGNAWGKHRKTIEQP
jgi:hypothetical protein